MKFVLPDTCIEDYRRRRDAFLKHLIATEPNIKERARRMHDWWEDNSPYEPHEKVRNLMRAIFGDERH